MIWNYVFFKSFDKKLRWNLIFLISWGKMAFPFLKNMLFFMDIRWKMIFIQKYVEIWRFLNVGKGGISLSYRYEITLLMIIRWSLIRWWSDDAKMIFFRKIHLKINFLALLEKTIFILEKIILAFPVLLCKTLSVFIYCFSTITTPGNLTYGVEI